MDGNYEKNAALLADAVARHAFLFPVKNHRLADGTLNVRGNLDVWNTAMEPFFKTPLWEKTPGWDARGALQREPYFVFVPAPRPDAHKPVVLVAHGGGFAWRSGCEGANAAWYFHNAGYPTAILAYRLKPYPRMAAVADMQRAIRLLRAGKDAFGTDGRVVAAGFSAGAMTAGNCATHFDAGAPDAPDAADRCSSRPDACVMCYGAFSAVSFPAPFGVDPDPDGMFGATPAERLYLAPEKNVTADTPPFFVWQTLSDDARHGLCLAKALADAQVPFELHVFEGGAHGLALADGENDLAADIPHIAHWARLCTEWLEMHGL